MDEGLARTGGAQGGRLLNDQSSGRESERIKLWLDDLREPPDSTWTWVKTVDEAIALMENCQVMEASLDHDLGVDAGGQQLPEGRRLVYWMAENECWPSDSMTVHSANVIGVEYMLGMIERYGPFIRAPGSQTFTRRMD